MVVPSLTNTISPEMSVRKISLFVNLSIVPLLGKPAKPAASQVITDIEGLTASINSCVDEVNALWWPTFSTSDFNSYFIFWTTFSVCLLQDFTPAPTQAMVVIPAIIFVPNFLIFIDNNL